jgi:hypothetical protein
MVRSVCKQFGIDRMQKYQKKIILNIMAGIRELELWNR